jgi:two-component system, LytTR family, response regulator
VTLRALVVDDEPVARRRLKTLLQSEADVTVIGECEDGAAAVDAIQRLRPDVVFLDVQMPGLDGFDVVEALGTGVHPAIVFVTAYDRYAVRAFEVHAVDYLLKPFERARLRKALERVATDTDRRAADRRVHAAVETVRAQQPLRRVLVKSADRIYAVRLEEVDYIEAAGHYLELHTGTSTHLVRESLTSIESRLDASRFVRIHRSTIVNLDRIRELQPAFHGEFLVTLHTGHRLPCSRTYADRLTKAMSS